MERITRLFYDTRARRLGPLVRGHVLLYEPREGPSYAASAGLRLLLIFLVLEVLIGPRMTALSLAGLESPPAGIRTLIMLGLALASVRLIAGVRLSEVGFTPLSGWRAAEVLYLAQVLVGASAVLLLMFGPRLGLFAGGPTAWLALSAVVATQLVWGFYQEVVYRGILQTELMRRFGAVAGALLANVAFTFGPLHLYHLSSANDPVRVAVMMAAIFVIGLIFAIIFARARNVWLVGLLHGVGNVFGAVAATGA